jgi:putative DNA primase/helicase
LVSEAARERQFGRKILGGAWLFRIEPTIGFLPASDQYSPAMVAAFALPNEVEPGKIGPPPKVEAVHLTRLLADGSDRVRDKGAKIVIGRPLGLPITLSCIGDGMSLTITEGIEDALAYAAAGYAVWAAGSAPLLPALDASIPGYITTVIIEQHPDATAQRATARLAALLSERPVRPAERKSHRLFVKDKRSAEFYPAERRIEIIIREADQ